MSRANEPAEYAGSGFLTTGDALVDGVLRGVDQSGRGAVEAFRALAKAVMWASLRELDGETEEMVSARELMHNGAQFFERALRQAKNAEVLAEIEADIESVEAA